MKKQILLLAALIFCSTLLAQAPQGITHQAVMRNTANDIVANQEIGIKVSILQGTAEGTAVFVETHQPESNQNGLITFVIGQGTPASGSFDEIDWSDGPYFLKTEADPEGGTNYSITGTTQFLSVPYALFSQTSADAFDGDMQGNRIVNLADPVDAQDGATKAYVDLLKERIENLELETGVKIQDIDGNVYKTVVIGNQVWMAENLKTTKYRNGTPIEYPSSDNDSWTNNTSGAYAWHQNNISWKNLYGALYNWHAVNNLNGLCPNGWYVPTDDDITQLVNYVVAQGYPNNEEDPSGAGNALKSCHQVNTPLEGNCNTTQHPRWNQNDIHFGLDEFGFSALPNGQRFTTGLYGGITERGYWWSATEYTISSSKFMNMEYDRGNIFRASLMKGLGFSVRCIKDSD